MSKWLPSNKLTWTDIDNEYHDEHHALVYKWANFIAENKSQRSEEFTEFEVTDQVMINKVNYQINMYRYTADKIDEWTLNKEGDCEDKALVKRKELHDLGIPLGAMSLAIGENRYGITHAVLILHTTEGDYVLDNENSLILPVDKTSVELHYIVIENKWYSILGIE